MKVKIINQKNGYSFKISSSDKDIFSSYYHYYLINPVKSNYKYAWRALKDALDIIRNKSSHLDVMKKYAFEERIVTNISAEEMLIDHYIEMLKVLRRKAKNAHKDKKEGDKVFKEIHMIIDELQAIEKNITTLEEKQKIRGLIGRFHKMLSEYFPGKKEKIKTASKIDVKNIDIHLKRDLLENYGERICKALEGIHRGAYYDVDAYKGEVVVNDLANGDGKPILKVGINDYLNINSIIPIGDLSKKYPFHSTAFYQRYWKPIIEGVGHFFLDDVSTLVLAYNGFPDVPSDSKTFTLEGWNVDNNNVQNVDISFSSEDPSWVFKESKIQREAQSQVKEVSKYTEQDYIDNPIVRCVDPVQKSIYGRTGSVEQIIPRIDMIEIDVNFGRGIGVIRLIEDQIEIVPLGN